MALPEKYLYREDLSRKGAKRYRASMGFLCAFAPLREKYSSSTDAFGYQVKRFRSWTGATAHVAAFGPLMAPAHSIFKPFESTRQIVC